MHSSCREVPFDFLRPGETLVETYLIANAVDGLPSGAYFYHRDGGALVQLKAGSFRGVSGYLCLEQPLFSDASVVIFLMADLNSITAVLGSRGYRTAEFEAGVVLGKIYLSAYAQRLGASGSTFYDDAVTDFFSPHTTNMNAMVAVGVGIPDYAARSGKILIARLTGSH